MKKVFLIEAIIFLSSFLLFQLELMIGKIFLPNYGGSYLVWGACVVFFQAALLAGYQYAHLITRHIRLSAYRYFHLAVLLIPFFSFPGRSLATTFPVNARLPLVLDVFSRLTVTIGLVFFALSTMSVLWQVWLSRSDLPQRRNPYFLFSVSNLGAFLALITYPLFFEPGLDVNRQQNIWRTAYAGLIVLQVLASILIDVKHDQPAVRLSGLASAGKPVWGWLAYSAAGVMIMLAVTNIATLEIVPMPLLWVIPLAIYLLSFVLVFKRQTFFPGWIMEQAHLILGYGILFFFFRQTGFLPLLVELALLFGIAFLLCLLAQYQLFLSRPADLRNLTYYYFMIGLGGFLGGVVATWIMPLISWQLLEYFGGFFLLYLMMTDRGKAGSSVWLIICVASLLLLLRFWPKVLFEHPRLGSVLIVAYFFVIFTKLRQIRYGLIAALAGTILFLNVLTPPWFRVDRYLYSKRNYYGINRVVQKHGVRYFLHGDIMHGAQYLDPDQQAVPLLYYGEDSTLGMILTAPGFDFKDIGAVGLGIGILSTYLRPGQSVDFFELDPEVLAVASRYFTFLKNSKGHIRHHIGDARLTLAATGGAKYDLLILDAFSGDAVPFHLLTVEALSLYRAHLREGGVILFHVTNHYIDLTRPLLSAAFQLGARCAYQVNTRTYPYTEPSTWVAVTWDDNRLQRLRSAVGMTAQSRADYQGVRFWTDRYSTLLPYMKFGEFWTNLLSFKR